MKRSIVIFSGGTGGHVYPGLAVATQLRKMGVTCHWVGTGSSLEARVIPENGFSFHSIKVKGFRGNGFIRWLTAPFILAQSILSALWILHCKKPDVVLGMGGFVSAPGGFAAWIYRCPLIIHEQNTIPGLANRILAYLSSCILEAFPNTFHSKLETTVTGNPVRQEIIQIGERRLKKVAGTTFNILIFGGSRGARILNEIVPQALSNVDKRNISIFHQCGSDSEERLKNEYKKYGLINDSRVCAYIDDMADAYGWADLVISRSGAMTLSELTTAGLISVLVPYKYAVDDHQTKNAEYYSERNAAFMIQEDKFTPDELKLLLNEIINNHDSYNAVGDTARSLGHARATGLVVDKCMEFINA
jgi:UDP-N-acetylglucosamine--N-acetylmuramyl-(pentapeptide) pyrophosphoryl-undecaprenol N-acetylglucosamine transferase